MKSIIIFFIILLLLASKCEDDEQLTDPTYEAVLIDAADYPPAYDTITWTRTYRNDNPPIPTLHWWTVDTTQFNVCETKLWKYTSMLYPAGIYPPVNAPYYAPKQSSNGDLLFFADSIMNGLGDLLDEHFRGDNNILWKEEFGCQDVDTSFF